MLNKAFLIIWKQWWFPTAQFPSFSKYYWKAFFYSETNENHVFLVPLYEHFCYTFWKIIGKNLQAELGLDIKSNPTTCCRVGRSLLTEVVQHSVSGSVPSCLQPLILLCKTTMNFAGDKGKICRKPYFLLLQPNKLKNLLKTATLLESHCVTHSFGLKFDLFGRIFPTGEKFSMWCTTSEG